MMMINKSTTTTTYRQVVMVKRSKDLNKSSGNLNLEKKLWCFSLMRKERENWFEYASKCECIWNKKENERESVIVNTCMMVIISHSSHVYVFFPIWKPFFIFAS